MRTYQEHYRECRKRNRIKGGKYADLYDLTVDTEVFGELPPDLISKIHEKMCAKIDASDGCHISPKHAIRLDSWKSIEEIKELVNTIMPQVEREVFGCPAKVEFVHLYRNVPFENQPDNEWDDSMYEASWKWHYDDCPREFLKMFINLNTVTADSGCFKLLLDEEGNAPVIPSYRIAPGYKARSQIYPASRIPPEVIKEKLEGGWTLLNAGGPPGSYAICTPNIYHRASCPKPGTDPRDVMFLFIRPSLESHDEYVTEETNGYPGWNGTPNKNVKGYTLD